MEQIEKLVQEEEVYEQDFKRIRQGLSRDEVERRIEANQTNAPVKPPSKTEKEIIINNICTYFNLIFAVITVLLIIVGSYRDLTFLPIIIANTLIGIVQQIRSKKTLDQLSVLNTPRARVVREGEEMDLPIEQLVLDDIVIFSAGNQICADAIVLEGEVQVNESLITGEADEITKRMDDALLSGSFIVSGKCYARLNKVGADSYASKLTLEAKAVKEGEQSEMMRSLNVIVKSVGIAIIPISIILFYQQYFIGGDSFKDSVTSTVAAVIGMIPEGLYLLTSVALAVSVRHLAKRKVLVHDMKCIETLARVDVLCVDKTGTITENKMTVSELVTLEGYEAIELTELMGDFTDNMARDNATMEALAAYFTQTTGRKADQVSSFSSATKYSGVRFGEEVYVLGAPEFVLRKQYEAYKEQITSLSGEGYRVVVFGRYEGNLDGKPLVGKVEPMAFVLLSNPIRKEAMKTFSYFAKQDVEIKVISGDHPITVSKIAEKAGIQNASRYIDASTLKTEEDIRQAILKYTVFGRVTPNQKRSFVRALKEAGHTVAMTGDGVNDVLALKDADCSIAMASGSDVAAQASQLVLLESNFACMPSVVKEGRRVVNNIERSASLFLVKNLFSFMMSLFAICFMVNYPLKPSQVSLISMFTIGIPAFLLALERNTSRIKGRFMTNVLFKALPAGLTDFFIVSALIIFGVEFGVDQDDVSTASVMLMAIVGFMILYRSSVPMNRWRLGIFLTMLVGFLFCIAFMSNLFAISSISIRCGMLLAVFAIASEPIFRYLSVGIYWINKTYVKFKMNKESILGNFDKDKEEDNG
ncbi:MAG: HAD family hydrolase [Cellulosilyticum sp.]|nr:HAD family hydrolase [Cellulosilyticum sp.]